MKKVFLFILSRFLPFLLVLGFARKSVDTSQKFLPTGAEVIQMLNTCPDFTEDINEDIKVINEFWLATQNTFFVVPDGKNYSEIWSDANNDNFFVKLGDTFKYLFQQIGQFFQCFVPFFKMVGQCFVLIGHALYMPLQFMTWFWNNLLGFSAP